MKKVLFALTLIASLSSCTKDKPKQCNCGLITDDRVSDYSVVIRNSCSGNEKRFILTPGDWVNAHVGSDYCITNATGW
jgi:hypothetical protein